MGTRVLLTRRQTPIRRNVVKRLPITRAPHDEPLSPGLRNKDRVVEAIGFHVDHIGGSDEGDE